MLNSDIQQARLHCNEIEESFEMTADAGKNLTEIQRIVEAANATAGEIIYPIGELSYQKIPSMSTRHCSCKIVSPPFSRMEKVE